VLQYLYYLSDVGIAMSPLAEDSLYCKYEDSPFTHYFKVGMNVSLSTDNPLQLHSTEEPLLEEYAVAAKMWNLSIADMSEIALRSVLQSGFGHNVKAQWLGPNYYKGLLENDPKKTNVSSARIKFRCSSKSYELKHLYSISHHMNKQRSRALSLHSSVNIVLSESLNQSNNSNNDNNNNNNFNQDAAVALLSGTHSLTEVGKITFAALFTALVLTALARKKKKEQQ